jgi:hypothetical protein
MKIANVDEMRRLAAKRLRSESGCLKKGTSQ